MNQTEIHTHTPLLESARLLPRAWITKHRKVSQTGPRQALILGM